MTSSKPYLLRAINDWVLDNGLTPHIMVDATVAGVVVPVGNVDNGRIVLNIAPAAVKDLLLGERSISFHARFAGTPYHIEIPMQAVMAIYARESGKGMIFQEQESEEALAERIAVKVKPGLKIVK